jgi:Spy/CpxP family protein refolding chaperone
MKITKIKWLFAAFLIGLFGVGIADPPPGMPMGPPMDGPMRQKVKDRIKMVKVWKLTEALNLTQAQAQTFFPIYNKFFDGREDFEMQKFQMIQKLEDLTAKENVSDKEINQQVDKIDSLDQHIQDLRLQFRKDVQGVLTTLQIGQLYVFEIKFIQQMQEIIRDARQEMRGKGFGKERDE